MIVIKSSLKYFSKHYLQTILAMIGIILGVSIVVAIDLCIVSSQKAFKTSLEQSFGKTTHYISASGDDIDQNIYKKIKEKIDFATPVIEKNILIKSGTGDWERIKLLGLDPFTYKDFDMDPKQGLTSLNSKNIKDFLLCTNCGYISKETASKLNIKKNQEIVFQHETEYKKIRIVDIVDKKNLENLILVDISTAQNLLGMSNQISRIDLITQNPSSLKPILGTGLELTESLKNKKSTQKMLDSFNLNLYSLSFLSLIVAVFLIYNTMSFSIVQRQTIFGIFRTLGLSSREIFKLVINETLILSVLSGLIGVILGYGLAHILIKFISQTINDLYFVVEISEVKLEIFTVIKGIVAGVFSALAGSLLPAYQASLSPAIQMTKRSNQELLFETYLKNLWKISLVSILVGFGILKFSESILVLNFVALAFILVGVAILVPNCVKLISSAFDKILISRLDPLNKIGIRSIFRNLSRTSITITALAMALSIALALDITVGSFRKTVIDWLSATLQSDIYISAPSLSANKTTGNLSKELIDEITKNKIIQTTSKDIISYRNNWVKSNLGELMIASIDFNERIEKSFEFKQKNPDWTQEFTKSNGIIISEPLAFRFKLKTGDLIKLKTHYGFHEFRIAGIFYDYGNEQGIIMIHNKKYKKLWMDYKISSLGIVIKPNLAKDPTISSIKQELAKLNRDYNFNYRSNSDLKQETLRIFDRTFQITKALKIITILIAFISIISTLLAMNFEKKKEFAILEALGTTKKNLAQITLTQSLSIGILSALFAIPLGLLQAVLLINVINYRSFGWTLRFYQDYSILFQILLIALLASLIAGLIPAIRHSKGYLALRND
jgi:putative ABC transport system permease protein